MSIVDEILQWHRSIKLHVAESERWRREDRARIQEAHDTYLAIYDLVHEQVAHQLRQAEAMEAIVAIMRAQARGEFVP